MHTVIIKTKHGKINSKNMKSAASAIRSGKVVVFPTETVYGIGANAFDEEACKKIFEAKGRPSDNPLIVHVSDLNMAKTVCFIPKKYEKYLLKVWPGPLTIISKAKNTVGKIVTANLDTVAVRMPSSSIALELIRTSGVPIAAPSANISKMPSSTSGKHALAYFNGKVDMILDAGRTKYGIESTVLDLRTFTVLRPGAFSVEDLTRAFGKKPRVHSENVVSIKKVRSPGMKYRHYSPNTPLFLYKGNIRDLNKMLKKHKKIVFIGSDNACSMIKGVQKIRLGNNQDEIAHNLFDALIKLDSVKVKFAVIQSFGIEGFGLAVMNRIEKASNHLSFKNEMQLHKLMNVYKK